jgi:hypothetical protein
MDDIARLLAVEALLADPEPSVTTPRKQTSTSCATGSGEPARRTYLPARHPRA